MQVVRRNITIWSNIVAKAAYGGLSGLFASRPGLFEKRLFKLMLVRLFCLRGKNVFGKRFIRESSFDSVYC